MTVPSFVRYAICASGELLPSVVCSELRRVLLRARTLPELDDRYQEFKAYQLERFAHGLGEAVLEQLAKRPRTGNILQDGILVTFEGVAEADASVHGFPERVLEIKARLWDIYAGSQVKEKIDEREESLLKEICTLRTKIRHLQQRLDDIAELSSRVDSESKTEALAFAWRTLRKILCEPEEDDE